KAVVTRIMNSVRPSDLVARMGGEEFIVIMPETTISLAQMVAERLRNKIAATPITVSEVPGPLNITVSIGCTATHGEGGDMH
ncbi:diguanylate cyclase, partial [Klebsiella pneumoniae]|uniref:diguanylate cyclase n=1 Tax=Klebsiella pneumoniae TaxID=573 RepID=UPI003EE37E82